MRRVEQDQGGDLVRESLGVPLNIGATQRVTDQHIRCRAGRGSQHGSELVGDLGGASRNRGILAPTGPGPVVEDRCGELGHPLLDQSEVKAERSGAGNEDDGGGALA